MIHAKKSKLARIFNSAKAKHETGIEITEQFLRKEFNLTVYGATCVQFMLEKNEFFPELEKIYQRDESLDLRGKDASQVKFIQFLEDMPPRKKGFVVFDELSEKNKAAYVSLGIAKYVSYEELRRINIQIYIKTTRLMNQFRLDMLEAVAHKNIEYISDHFQGLTVSKIKKRLELLGIKGVKQKIIFRLLNGNKTAAEDR